MRLSFLLVLLLLEMVPVHAQTTSFDVGTFFDSLSPFYDVLNRWGLFPNFSKYSEENKQISFFERDDVKAYMILLLMVFLVLVNIVEFSDSISFIASYFLVGFLYNHFHMIFVKDIASGFFEYVFSALFLFVWTDYIFSFAWVLKKSTRLLIVSAITMIGVSFMSFTQIKTLIFAWINFGFTGVGLILFLVFMIGMRIFTTYSRMVEISGKYLSGGGENKEDEGAEDNQQESESGGGE